MDRIVLELRDYLRIARRYWLLIVGCVVVAGVVSGLVTAQMTKQYASTAQLFITTSQSSTSDAYQGSLFSEQRVSSYAQVLKGREIAQRVKRDLGLSMSATELSGRISASVVPDTVVLQVTVTDPQPRQAQKINRAVVGELQHFISEVETPPARKHPLVKATISDAPTLPASPVSPKPLRNIGLAIVLGLLLGFGLAVLREVLDTSVKRVDDVPWLEDTPMLGALAFDADVHKHPLVSSLPTHAPRYEAFRVLRTNLQFLDVDSPSKVFVVTSSLGGEGKTTTAVNTALALASAGTKVLLMDADLRRPQVAKTLSIEGAVGITTLLLGRVGLDDAIQRHNVSGLDVLTSGSVPPNPAELLQSRVMRALLDEVRERYDVIIIDSPPLLPVTDAALLASETDGAILVVRHSKTKRDQLAHAVERLRAVEAEPLGVVFNMVPRKPGIGGYGYGYGYGYAPERRAVQRLPDEAVGSATHDPAANKTTGKRRRERGFIDDVLQ